MEGCQSGRMGHPGKVVYPKGYREFESRSLRFCLIMAVKIEDTVVAALCRILIYV